MGNLKINGENLPVLSMFIHGKRFWNCVSWRERGRLLCAVWRKAWFVTHLSPVNPAIFSMARYLHMEVVKTANN
jgi:hypothetical protein